MAEDSSSFFVRVITDPIPLRIWLRLGVVVALVTAGCNGESTGQPRRHGDAGPNHTPTASKYDLAGWTLPPVEVLDQLPHGQDQLSTLCARGNQDPIAQAFCAGAPPNVTSLVELQRLLGVDIIARDMPSGRGGNPAFALAGHSPSLNVRLASSINPRAIVFTPPEPFGQPREGAPAPNDRYVAMAFTRGEQFVELAARDSSTDDTLRLYLFKFEQTCNENGCSPEDLYAPKVEQGFTGYSLYEDVDLTDTAVDCLQCHQPGGAGTERVLLMQQLQPPWTHFMSGFGVGGPMLLDDYFGAHAESEAYAGIPGTILKSSDPEALQMLVENNGFVAQPIEYPGTVIETEVRESSPDQPYVNDPPGNSPTWEALLSYALTTTGNRPAYHDVQVADIERKVAFATAYKQYMQGALAEGDFPDLAGVLLDDALPDLGIRPTPGASGEEIVMQVCGRCHHDAMDPSLSRSRFNAMRPGELSAEAKALAIGRLQLAPTSPRAMPPIRNAELSQQERQRAIDFLSR